MLPGSHLLTDDAEQGMLCPLENNRFNMFSTKITGNLNIYYFYFSNHIAYDGVLLAVE